MDCGLDPFACVTTTSDGYKYYFDGTTYYRVGADLPHTVPDGSGPKATYVFGFTPDCSSNTGPTDDVMCVSATTACAALGQQGVLMVEWYRETAPVPGNWTRGATLCTGPGTVVTLAQVRAGVNTQIEDIVKHLPSQQPTVQPDDPVLVNLPAIVIAPAPGNPDFAVTLPLPGQVHITATYHWDFGDGTGLDTDQIGTGYDGTDPRQAPGHYLSHTYAKAQANTAVTLTVTWHATFAVAGVAPITLPDVVLPPLTKVIQVHEARGVLVTG